MPRVLVELKFTGISPNPSPLTSISTVVLASRLSASSRNRAESAKYLAAPRDHALADPGERA